MDILFLAIVFGLSFLLVLGAFMSSKGHNKTFWFIVFVVAVIDVVLFFGLHENTMRAFL